MCGHHAGQGKLQKKLNLKGILWWIPQYFQGDSWMYPDPNVGPLWAIPFLSPI